MGRCAVPQPAATAVDPSIEVSPPPPSRARPGTLSGSAPMPPRRHLPNLLTVLRLVLAAVFFMALNAYRYPDDDRMWANVAIAVFIVAAITDALDGHLARR